ncbi:MAG: class I adenylate-forming enzyme family protein [Faecalibacterium sp.]
MQNDNTPVYASSARPWLAFYDKKFIGQTLPACTAFDFICRQNRGNLSAPALEYYGRSIRYADLIVNIKKTAAALRAAGVQKGDIITLVSVMTPEVIYCFYAADMLGATLNLVDPRYSPEGICAYIQEVRSRLLICLNVVYERCRQAARRTSVEKILVISPADSLPLPMAIGYRLTSPDKNRYASNVILWKDFIAAGQGQSTHAEPYDPQHACVVVHTGGTTGSPKGVMLSDDNFNALAAQFFACEKVFQRGQKLMNIMPPFIAYGFACGIHLPLTLGMKVIIIPNIEDGAKLGSLVLKHKPEHMFGVPAHYQKIAADPRLKNKDLSFVLNYAAGGDAISLGAEENVNRFLAAHHAPYALAKGYGMTEVSSAATSAEGLLNKPGSVGIPLVNTLVSVFEVGTDQELPIGERGEICISGPGTMMGYYGKPEETAAILRRHADGRVWVHTGDIGYMDSQGYVFLDSRIKRLIIRHDGFKVFPSMIENVVSLHPAVQQCSVVGIADKEHVQGRLPFVYAVLDPACTAPKKQIVQELSQLCAKELPEYVQPAGYRFLSEMPYTPAGKVDYRKLEERLAADQK